jgi:alpha-D-ribose 1-methylphosphonate 5-triphosphate synthase subunit PhnG
MAQKIDEEVFELERRIAERQHEIAVLAQATGRSALRALASPSALLIALAAGFVVGGGIGRRTRRPQPQYIAIAPPDASVKVVKAKGGGLGRMLAAGALSLLRARYGTPAALAQMVLSRLRHR